MDRLIRAFLNEYLEPRGFEAHPFLVKWYNELVQPELRLPYGDLTLAYVIVSSPSSFEKAFLPYCEQQVRLPQSDLYDNFMKNTFSEITSLFPAELQPDMIHDFDFVLPSRRPRVVMQTAAHVSGAAFHYDFRRELRDKIHGIDDVIGHRKLLGVCIHPKYGGWFGLRGVAIFSALEDETLVRRETPDVLGDDLDRKLRLCEEFNLRYADNSYRDVSKPIERYSKLQQEFWRTLPTDRPAFMTDYLLTAASTT